jgi:hypothetical protein
MQATPVPSVADLDALNAMFRARCVQERERTVASYAESIGQRLERDRAAAVALPAHPFDACVLQPGQVDKFQTVRFDCNRYNVPRALAFQMVMVNGYIDRIEVVAGDDMVARHTRSYGRDEQILDLLHYLAALGRRRWITRRGCAICSSPRGSHNCVRPWKNATSKPPAHGISCVIRSS